MKPNISLTGFHKRLAKDIFITPPGDEQILCLMMLLHACMIEVEDTEVCIDGYSYPCRIEGITTRDAASVAAALFDSGSRSDYFHWYYVWNSDWQAYRLLEELPADLRHPVRRMRDKIESHPWVRCLVNDDWDLLDMCELDSDEQQK